MGETPSEFYFNSDVAFLHFRLKQDNISLEDPAGTAPVAQDDVALIDGVCRRSFLPEPVRVRVGRRLRDGIERQQVERLHCPISHRGNPERTLLAVLLRYVQAS
jgi:hypothetical protein